MEATHSDAFFDLLFLDAGSWAELEEDEESGDSATDSSSAGAASRQVVPKHREHLDTSHVHIYNDETSSNEIRP